jgi:glyoxylase-like metal-dependent hydrolase (beta-lactamase superfamily II)
MRLGGFQIDLLSDGQFWLDGGAMFGVIPRALWGKVAAPDDKNRIRLGLNCLLIRTGSKNILIDTGCGHKYSEKQIRIYGIEHTSSLDAELARVEVSPSEIDLVINTHLHFDHCGGNTRLEEGRTVPSFANAMYLINSREYEDANRANERTQASYFQHNWTSLEEQGQIRLVDGDLEVAEGIMIVHTPGHTLGHQSVKISTAGRTLFYFGDLCPTTAHVPLPWIMSYDLYPLTTLETRKKIYEDAAREGWLVLFEHDPVQAAGYLKEEDGKYFAETVDWED